MLLGSLQYWRPAGMCKIFRDAVHPQKNQVRKQAARVASSLSCTWCGSQKLTRDQCSFYSDCKLLQSLRNEQSRQQCVAFVFVVIFTLIFRYIYIYMDRPIVLFIDPLSKGHVFGICCCLNKEKNVRIVTFFTTLLVRRLTPLSVARHVGGSWNVEAIGFKT